jgi:hypothetical protein
MPNPTLPLEIRSAIYQNLDNPTIAKDIPEVFWAIVPNFFRHLTLGVQHSIGYSPETLQTKLVKRYPESGGFVEELTLYAERASVTFVSNFLKKTPVFRKLKHIRILYSGLDNSYSFANEIPYLDVLEDVIKNADALTRLSFESINPCSTLLGAATDKLIRLDLGTFYSSDNDSDVRLPRSLEVLIFTPSSSLYIYGPTPLLRVIGIKKDDVSNNYFAVKLRYFIDSCPLLTSLAIFDASEYTDYFYLI